jgi:hypothetical protein
MLLLSQEWGKSPKALALSKSKIFSLIPLLRAINMANVYRHTPTERWFGQREDCEFCGNVAFESKSYYIPATVKGRT